LPCRVNGLNVRLLHPHTGQLLREHLRQKRGWHRIQEADRSPRTPPSIVQLLGRAYWHALHRHSSTAGQVGVRRIQGVLALAKKLDQCWSIRPAPRPWSWAYEYHFVRLIWSASR